METLSLTLINRDRLPEKFKDLEASDLLELGSALQGARISAGFKRQNEIFPVIKKALYPDLEPYKDVERKKQAGEWDFIDHTKKICIDSKSFAYNNNIKPKEQCAKYKEHAPDGYKMMFIITNATGGSKDVSWPVEEYKEHGIEIITIQELLNETDIQVQWR